MLKINKNQDLELIQWKIHSNLINMLLNFLIDYFQKLFKN